jgi:hypothetical protein
MDLVVNVINFYASNLLLSATKDYQMIGNWDFTWIFT